MPAISRAPLRSQPSACLLLAAALLVSGCSSLPSKTQPGGIEQSATQTGAGLNQRHLASIEHIQDFNIEGRIGVHTDGRGVSGTIHWKHVNNKDDIALFSPMGGKMADVKSTDGNVTLTANDGKTYTAADAETLTQQTLGWRLPVSNLADWVVGRPTNDAIEQITWDYTGKLTKLTQDGWEIQYLEYRQASGVQLPSKLALRNPKLYMKFIVERWDTLNAQPVAIQPAAVQPAPAP